MKQPFLVITHGEADGLPGVVIDRFGDSAVFQPNSFWADCYKEEILDSLVSLGMKNIVLNGMSRSRKMEGLDQITEVVVDFKDGESAYEWCEVFC